MKNLKRYRTLFVLAAVLLQPAVLEEPAATSAVETAVPD